MCMAKVVKDDTQLWLMNSFKKSTNECVETVASRYQNFLKDFHKFRGLLCMELSRTDWFTTSSVHVGYQNNWLAFTKLKEWGQPWRFFSSTRKKGKNFLTELWLATRLGYSSWIQRPKSSLNSGCTRILPTSPRNLNKHCRTQNDGYSTLEPQENFLTDFMAPGTIIMSEVYCETLHKLLRSIQIKRRGTLSKGVLLLHYNARSHTAARTNALIKLFNWEIFDHPPYSPDLAPSSYHLFSKMKVWLATQRFHTNEEHMDSVNTWLRILAAPFFDDGLQKLVPL